MDAFRQWAESTQCQNMIVKFSRRLRGRVIPGVSAQKLEAFIEDAPGKMWEKLKRMADRPVLDPTVLHLVQSQQWDKLLNMVLEQVRRGSIDDERKTDPSRKLYKKAQEALHNGEPPLITRVVKGNSGSEYSLDQSAGNWPGLALEDFTAPDPLAHVPFDDIYRARSLCLLATLFWKAVRDAISRPVWIPVRVFVEYLKRNYPVAVELSEYQDEAYGAYVDIEVGSAEYLELARSVASGMVSLWDERKMKALLMHIEQDCTLKDIAHAVGFSAPPGAKALLDRMSASMVEHMALKGYTGENLVKVFWDDVLSFVLEDCKSVLSRRDPS